MRVLRQGSSGVQVKFLQRLLNKAASRAGISGATLAEDGGFGALTENALYQFQLRTPGLVSDKTVGPQTWNALGLKSWKEHNWVRLVPQNERNCWSAAASMIKGPLSIGPHGAPVNKDHGIEGGEKSLRIFAQALGWEYLEYTCTVKTLINLVFRTPIWLFATFNYNAINYNNYGGRYYPDSWGHVVVPSAVYTDGDPSGDGTLFRVHDPAPVGKGKIYGTFGDSFCILGLWGDPYPVENFHTMDILVPR